MPEYTSTNGVANFELRPHTSTNGTANFSLEDIIPPTATFGQTGQNLFSLSQLPVGNYIELLPL